MIRDIVRMGDPRLLRVAQPVREFGTAELQSLVDDMFDTMHAAGGVGLAAPQIGVDLQVIVFGFDVSERHTDTVPVPRTVLINPVVTPLSEDVEEGWEGCLSIPGLRAVINRHRHIRYQGMDQIGQPLSCEAEGFHARVVQHEYDHLIGVLYPMRITDFSKFGYTDVLFPQQPSTGDD